MKRLFPVLVAVGVFSLLLPVGCAPKEEAGHDTQAQAEVSPPPSHGGAEAETAPAQVAASHILISYQGAMRSTQTRTKEEARALAEEVLAKAKAGEVSFTDLVHQYSDDPTISRNHGNLGTFGRGAMVPAFEEAAFALKVGETSGIVETPFGFHIIERTE